MRQKPIIFDTMAGRPSLGLKTKSFSLYEKTRLILKKLEFESAQTNKKKKMIELAHEAVEQYASNNSVSNEDKNGKVKK